MPLQNISADELRKKFLSFFKVKGHRVIPSSSLVPENDPTVLFTTAGMHPLVPYLLGEKHPEGTRLCNVQRCVRTDDIDEVGDETHLTFFEMLGNWSLGDYWKDDAIAWSYEFLVSPEWLGIDKKRLSVSVFAGDEDAPFDKESFDIWRGLGISEDRIAKLSKKDNWWGPAGQTGPCGPDTEMFIWNGSGDAPEKFDPENKNWVEVWNDVFMQYNLTAHGGYEPLKQRNVDTGMGLERMLAILNNQLDIYKTELFWPIIEKLESITGIEYKDEKITMRRIADHYRSTVEIIKDGICPGKNGRESVLRTLLRVIFIEIKYLMQAREEAIAVNPGVEAVKFALRNQYRDYSEVVQQLYENNDENIKREVMKEYSAFLYLGTSGMKFIGEMMKKDVITGSDLFEGRGTFGLDIPSIVKILTDVGGKSVEKNYEENYKIAEREHQQKSRSASAGMFKGGLADNSEQTTKYHTAAHLMLVALKQVLGDYVEQKGSNINAERLRFDFNNPEKLTDEQIKKVEDIVNEQIQKSLPVTMQEMSLDEAKPSGAHGIFDDRYGNKVKVYTIGDPASPFSCEICGGPHVKNTSELGHFKIIKEESSSAGVRRIKAVLK
jgi:alanyl-tRNA synthetase